MNAAKTAVTQYETDSKFKELKDKIAALNPGLGANTQAAVDAKLKAGKRVYLLSEVDETLVINGQFAEFNDKLAAESLLWEGKVADTDQSVVKDDSASEVANKDDAEKKAAWANRVKADRMIKKGVDALQTYIKDQVLGEYAKADTDEKKKAFKVSKSGFEAAVAAYENEAIKGQVGILEALVATTDATANKADADAYAAYLKFMKDEQKKSEQKAADTAAAAADEGGSLMWLWCILIGLVAIVGIFFLYRYCKNKDDKQD